ncbi:MAG: hypothetical protein AB7Q16_23725 [Vicinamibacterales bacterium]
MHEDRVLSFQEAAHSLADPVHVARLAARRMSDCPESPPQMVVPYSRVACVLAKRHEPSLRTEEARAARFSEITFASRATDFRIKARPARAM